MLTVAAEEGIIGPEGDVDSNAAGPARDPRLSMFANDGRTPLAVVGLPALAPMGDAGEPGDDDGICWFPVLIAIGPGCCRVGRDEVLGAAGALVVEASGSKGVGLEGERRLPIFLNGNSGRAGLGNVFVVVSVAIVVVE